MWAQALVAVVLVVVALLAVPVDVRCRSDLQAAERWSLQVGWLFGLVRIRRTSRSGKAEVTAEPAAVEAAPKRKRARSRRGGMPPALRSPAFMRRALRLVRKLLGRIRFRQFAVRLRVGLDDPADTGQLMGILLPLAAFVRPHLPGPLTVLPTFDGADLEGLAEADVRVIPLRLIGPLVTFGAGAALHLWMPTRVRNP